MKRVVSIGAQDFCDIVRHNCFLVDKTSFIKEWWENEDIVTLITRPRRFGKTLNLSMLDYFFSERHQEDAEVFHDLVIWKEEKYRKLHGTFPVISLTFAAVKQQTFQEVYGKICSVLYWTYEKYRYIISGTLLSDKLKQSFLECMDKLHEDYMNGSMNNRVIAEEAIQNLSFFLSQYYGKKVLIFLDEYDTPMLEAYVNGYWGEAVKFFRSMFNATFKTNPYMDRAIMTGITRVSKESIFSDLNNLTLVTTTSQKYSTAFGFTEEEVFAAMDEMNLTEKNLVKKWYDGFRFGSISDIYNPWSITNYLDNGVLDVYWANTSGNALVSKLLREGSKEIKNDFEDLMRGKEIHKPIDEQIIYNQLDHREDAVWSLLVAGGYLKILSHESYVAPGGRRRRSPAYTLAITNLETQIMFENMVEEWFEKSLTQYNEFVKAMFNGNLEEMNYYMNKVALESFSYFDTGKNKFDVTESFYHGFVLGLLVMTSDQYEIRSNRESGLGRYDVMLFPLNPADYGYILEFKVFYEKKETSLEDTAAAALAQIEEKRYEEELVARGISVNRIRKYGFAFYGKEVLIKGG